MNKITFNLTNYYKAIDTITKGLLVHDVVIRMFPNSTNYIVFVVFKQDISLVIERLLHHPYVLQIDHYGYSTKDGSIELYEIRVPLSIIDRFN